MRTTVLCLALLAATCSPAPPEGPHPNLLILSIDTLRADRLGCYGYGRPTSPAIDELAARSVVFEAASSASSWTLPSMTSLMTGMTVSGHNCDRLGSRLDPSYTTLAEILRDAGYDTQIVASHLFLSAPYGLQQGFTHVDTSVVQDENDITSQDVSALGLQWLQQKSAVHDGVPWMLWLHYFDPHAPYLLHPGISPGFGTDSDADRYDGEIAYTDRHVGRLLEELARSPLAANTIVVIVADHGEEFGEHGNFGHGYALYEECVRVPLIVHAPGIEPRRVSEPVPTIDLLPTLLELCRVEARDEVEGRTILPLLRGETQPAQESLSEVRWQSGQDLRSLRSGAWKRIEGRVQGNPFEQLFDLGEDPGERSDLSAKESARAAALGARALERVRAAQARAGEHHQIGTTGPSPFEQKRLENTGYAGSGEGGVPQKPK